MVPIDPTDPGWLHLAKPLRGELGGQRVVVLDISSRGALVEVRGDLPADSRALLTFTWNDEALELQTERTHIEEGFWNEDARQWLTEVEVRFTSRSSLLDRMLTEYLNQVEAARQANLSGNIDANRVESDRTLADLGSARRRTDHGFIQLRLVGNSWRSNRVPTADQPADGFTVSRYEDEGQTEILRLAYEEADEEGRDLIRHFAALSITQSDASQT